MRLYFDNNVYNRPFDDQSIPRNRAEARAVEVLLGRSGSGEVELVSSFVVEDEHFRLPDQTRWERVGDLIFFARDHVASNAEILDRATSLERAGFGSGDALHLAAAEDAGVDYFVTCDDKLLSRARRTNISVRIVLPTELVEEDFI